MLKEKIKIKKLKVHKDERGLLAKIFGHADLKGKNLQDIYVAYTKAGKNRADHYHKKTTEWFCPIKGKGVMRFRDIGTNEKLEINLDSEEPMVIEVPPGINHQIFSDEGEFILIAFGNQPYNQEDDDTYST